MKKNNRKTKEGWKKAHNKRIKQAIIEGAKMNCKCTIESFQAIQETTDKETMSFAEVIMFMELTMENLENKLREHLQ